MTRLEEVLRGVQVWPPPVWLMRQAGRYLPEYRKLREEAGSFVGLCRTPELAAAVTLQPVERFGLDAAIVFSDILVVAAALGQGLDFVDGEGPKLTPVLEPCTLDRLSGEGSKDWLSPVEETLRCVSGKLPSDVALIGFCGGPWTVATYMAAGGASPDGLAARSWVLEDPASFDVLIDRLVAVSIDHLVAQARAGANVLQIFESAGGLLDEAGFARWVIGPTRRLVEGVRVQVPDVPVIGFPRGAGALALRYVAETGIDAITIDWTVGAQLGQALQARLPVQGNIDPAALRVGGQVLVRAVDAAAAVFSRGPWICNLGHGVVKDTPPDHVARLVERVRALPDPLA